MGGLTIETRSSSGVNLGVFGRLVWQFVQNPCKYKITNWMGELTIETIVPTGLIVGLLVGSFDCQFRIPVNANFYSKRDPRWRIMRSLIVGTYHRNGISHWHDFRPFGKLVWLLVQNPCKCKILVETRSSLENYEILDCRNLPSKRYFPPA